MYRVLLIDDEAWITESLKVEIPWKEQGFIVCGTAADGETALEMARSLRPDVIFSDIKMPGCSGLELVRRVKEWNPELLSVLISGYSDFEYGKEAIRCGVDGYCLKPIEEEEIINFLVQFREKLDAGRAARGSILLLESIERDDAGEVERYFAPNRRFNLLVSNGGELPLQGADVLTGAASRRCRIYVTPPWALSETDLRGFMAVPIQGLGLYRFDVSEGSLASAVNEAISRSFQYFFDPAERICDHGASALVQEQFLELMERIQRQTWEKDIAAFHQSSLKMQAILRSLTMKEIKKLWNLLGATQLLNGCGEKPVERSWEALCDEYANADAFLANWVTEMKHLLLPRDEPIPSYSANWLIAEVLAYIAKNYQAALSLTALAEQFSISPSHLSVLFKKETGWNLMRYITSVRMKKACALLSGSSLSVNDVSQEVGYEDYLYFRKVFKKIVGFTATEYREKNS